MECLLEFFQSQEIGLALTHIVLGLPPIFVWVVLATGNGFGVGLNHFISEQPTHYARREDETVLTRYLRLFLSSPGIWTQGFLALYICLFWVMVLDVFPNPDQEITPALQSSWVTGTLMFSQIWVALRLCVNHEDETHTFLPCVFEFLRSAIAVYVGYQVFQLIGGFWVANDLAGAIMQTYSQALEWQLFGDMRWLASITIHTLMLAAGLILFYGLLRLILATRPIAAFYLQFLFLLFVAVYVVYVLIPGEYRFYFVSGAIGWMFLVFWFNKVILDRGLKFDGLKDKGGRDLYDVLADRSQASIIAGSEVPDTVGKLAPLTTLKKWKPHAFAAQGLAKGKKPKLVLVATTGGASRSAYWTALVLDRLAKSKQKGITQSVRVIAGASGGMVGASFLHHWPIRIPRISPAMSLSSWKIRPGIVRCGSTATPGCHGIRLPASFNNLSFPT